MDSLGNLMPLISQLVGGLTARDRGHQSRADMEVLVRSVVSDCFQQHVATERRDMLNVLVDLLKESVTRPAETRPTQHDSELDDLIKKLRDMNTGKATKQSGKDEMRSDKKMMLEVLQEILAEQKSGQNNSSQSKFSDKGKQFSDKKRSVNDEPGKSFNNDRGAFEKRNYSSQQSKNFNQEGGAYRGGNRRNFSQGRQNKGSDGIDGGDLHRMNSMPQAKPNNYGDGQRSRSEHRNQNWQHGAVGYGPSNVAPHHRPGNPQMYQQQFGMPPSHAYNNYQQYPANYNTDYSNRGGFPNQQLGHNTFQNSGRAPPQYVPQNNIHPLIPPQNNLHPQMQPHHSGPNFNYHATEPNFNPQRNNFRGRGGFQRGGYHNRGGSTNRPVSRGDNSEIHHSFSDLTAGLSPDELKTIKNVLGPVARGVQAKKSNNKVAFKPKKNNPPGKFTEQDTDEQNDYDATNENKVLEDMKPVEVQSTGAKKKRNAKQSGVPEDDQKPKEVGADTSSAAKDGGSLKLLMGLGINKDVLNNVDLNQTVKHVVLISRCGDETKTCEPKIVKEFKEFLEKYPKAEAIIVKKG